MRDDDAAGKGPVLNFLAALHAVPSSESLMYF